jgi:hypothetical protein
VVFEAVQVLVPLAADLAAIRFLLLHAEGTRVRSRCFWVNDGECTISIIMQLLIVVAMLD